MKTTKHGILKKSLCFLLCVFMMSAAVPVSHAAGVYSEGNSPSDESTYGYTYRFVTADTIEITSYFGYEAEVTVPETIDGFTVVGIAGLHPNAGSSTALSPWIKRVVLPDTVTYIGEDAFALCDNVSVQFLGTRAPALGGDIFTGAQNYVIYVLSGYENAFNTTEGWGKYTLTSYVA